MLQEFFYLFRSSLHSLSVPYTFFRFFFYFLILYFRNFFILFKRILLFFPLSLSLSLFFSFLSLSLLFSFSSCHHPSFRYISADMVVRIWCFRWVCLPILARRCDVMLLLLLHCLAYLAGVCRFVPLSPFPSPSLSPARLPCTPHWNGHKSCTHI